MPLTLLLPIIILAGAGALLVRLRWLRPGWQLGLTELTAKLLIPALLFTSTYRTGMPASVSWQVLCAFYLPLLALFLLVAFGRHGGGDGAGRALASVYSNTVFVGIPIVLNVFGQARLQFAFPIIAFHSLVGFTLYYLCRETGAGAGTGTGTARIRQSLFSAVKNPIVLSLFGGLALNFSGLALPSVLVRPLDMLAGATLPCALLALGASLTGLRLHGWREPVLVSVVKLLVLPLCVWLLSAFVFRVPADVQAVLVILASCPVGINAAFVIAADGKDTDAVHSAILLSSLACAATIPLWLHVLAAFGIG